MTSRDRLECLTEIWDTSTFFSELVVFEFDDKMEDIIVLVAGQRAKMRNGPAQSRRWSP